MAVKPTLSEVFSTSPLSLLERHAEACLDCVQRLGPYFDAAQSGNWGLAEELQQEIARLEALADDLKLDVRKNLPRGLWTSVSRTDLLELVRVQDKIANETKDIAGLSLGRQLKFPKKLEKPVFKFIVTVTDASRKACQVVSATRELSRTAFRGRQVALGTQNRVEASVEPTLPDCHLLNFLQDRLEG